MGQLTGHCHAAGNEAGHLLSMSTPDEAPVDHAVYSEFAIKHIRIMRIIFTSLRDGNRPHRIVGLKVLIVGKKKREEFDSHV